MSDDPAAVIRILLNEWDPIGVASVVPDEYDGLIGPLEERLRAGEGVAEITQFLWFELGDRFGLDPFLHNPEPVAQLIVTAWRTRP